MTTWFILSFVAFFGSVIAMIYASCHDKDGRAAPVGVIGGMLLVVSGIMVYVYTTSEHKSPSAIDVYRGKTTLQITYQDSIPIDTTVVWKEEK